MKVLQVKRFFVVLLSLLLILSLTSCGEITVVTGNETVEEGTKDKENKQEEYRKILADTFVVISEDKVGRFIVVYDKDTLVMYVMSTGHENSGNFTMLVNADGYPKIYKEK